MPLTENRWFAGVQEFDTSLMYGLKHRYSVINHPIQINNFARVHYEVKLSYRSSIACHRFISVVFAAWIPSLKAMFPALPPQSKRIWGFRLLWLTAGLTCRGVLRHMCRRRNIISSLLKPVQLSWVYLAIAVKNRGWHSTPVWVGPDVWNYSEFDENVAKIIAADPNALILPRVHVTEPDWWRQMNPAEVMVYDDGGVDYFNPHRLWPAMKSKTWPSIASQQWRQDMCVALRKFIEHIPEPALCPGIFLVIKYLAWLLKSGTITLHRKHNSAITAFTCRNTFRTGSSKNTGRRTI